MVGEVLVYASCPQAATNKKKFLEKRKKFLTNGYEHDIISQLSRQRTEYGLEEI